MKRQSFYIALSLAIAVGIIASGTVIHLLTESWWFESVGYGGVFHTQLLWPILLWGGTALIHMIILGINFQIAVRLTDTGGVMRIGQSRVEFSASQLSPWFGAVLVFFLSITAAANAAVQWQKVLQFIHQTPFGQVDPIFGLDLGFYFFQLPFYRVLHGTLLSVVGSSLFIVVVLYMIKGAIDFNRGWRRFLSPSAKLHVAVLLAVLALLMAAGFWLQRYEILYSSSGVVFGAGYTDVHARLQSYHIMTLLTLGLGGLFILSLWREDMILPLSGVSLYGLLTVLVMGVYPNVQQQFQVEPNELTKEAPYIAHNLDFTRQAYQLDQIQRQAYTVENDLTTTALQDNQDTLNNIRLWNVDPLLSTYRQLQELRLYYRFQGVDIDRYRIGDEYRQVMLSAREMDTRRLPSQTWVNQRLKYTHGYGLVMSPVDQVTKDGLPSFLIKDLPPVTPPELPVEQTGIYYGELTGTYIFTGTSTDEFDYPLGSDNASTRYAGLGGVPMPSLWHRLAYALDFGSMKILISQYFTPESRIHYYRQIQQRVQHIAPFLYYDQDPYLVLTEGKLKWVLDAYTASDRYPYSQPISFMTGAAQVLQGSDAARLLGQGANYIRNSVKVVVDAYDGSVTFYAMDNEPYGQIDPILSTYRNIFPGLFVPSTEMPATLQQHLRYPRDLFTVQSLLYLSYHMDNPEVFYNQEDLWSFPTEVFEGSQPILSEPYYLIMQLPEKDQPEMVLIFPFTPVNKDNMIAWMAARSDRDQYGELLLYEFPKQELVYGPSQIEARIDQTPEISQQLTLWSQQGSRVIRGNLLVIPIERSLLYVEPIYLRAEQGELPELRRVIVSYGDQIIMEPTLEQGLNIVFGKLPVGALPTATNNPSDLPEAASATAITLPEDLRELIGDALDLYEQGEAALRKGDWETYGRSQDELEQILRTLDQNNAVQGRGE